MLHSMLKSELDWNDDQCKKIIIGVPDQMIENWVYAGLTGENIDGKHGKDELTRQLGVKYKVSMLMSVVKREDFKPKNALTSPSFAAFAKALIPTQCPKLSSSS